MSAHGQSAHGQWGHATSFDQVWARLHRFTCRREYCAFAILRSLLPEAAMTKRHVLSVLGLFALTNADPLSAFAAATCPDAKTFIVQLEVGRGVLRWNGRQTSEPNFSKYLETVKSQVSPPPISVRPAEPRDDAALKSVEDRIRQMGIPLLPAACDRH
jgi:hypothetical protein